VPEDRIPARGTGNFPERKDKAMNEQLIVIIDDDELILTIAEAILENAGYKVRTASNSILANQYIFCDTKPSLIIMDVMMPMLQGDKVAKLLKENADTRSIPILFLSGKETEELDALVAETGANGYLAKPFAREQLVEAVRKILPSSQ
jgi:two-component system, chemotaxis family, chemotaxis protein CheY